MQKVYLEHMLLTFGFERQIKPNLKNAFFLSFYDIRSDGLRYDFGYMKSLNHIKVKLLFVFALSNDTTFNPQAQ